MGESETYFSRICCWQLVYNAEIGFPNMLTKMSKGSPFFQCINNEHYAEVYVIAMVSFILYFHRFSLLNYIFFYILNLWLWHRLSLQRFLFSLSGIWLFCVSSKQTNEKKKSTQKLINTHC